MGDAREEGGGAGARERSLTGGPGSPVGSYIAASEGPVAALWVVGVPLAGMTVLDVMVGGGAAGSQLLAFRFLHGLGGVFNASVSWVPPAMILVTLAVMAVVGPSGGSGGGLGGGLGVGRRGRTRWWVPLAMVVEASVWALLLGVTVGLIARVVGSGAGGFEAAAGSAVGAGASVWARAVLAGIYEEFVFRLVLVSVLWRGLNAGGVERLWSKTIAVVFSAVAFGVAHWPVVREAGGDAVGLLPFVAGGVFLGALFAGRGFAMAALAHAVFNVVGRLASWG